MTDYFIYLQYALVLMAEIISYNGYFRIKFEVYYTCQVVVKWFHLSPMFSCILLFNFQNDSLTAEHNSPGLSAPGLPEQLKYENDRLKLALAQRYVLNILQNVEG